MLYDGSRQSSGKEAGNDLCITTFSLLVVVVQNKVLALLQSCFNS